MRRSRSKNSRRLLQVGYHKDDVKIRSEAIASQTARTELLLKQESDRFAELLRQKLALQDELQQMLEQALTKERKLMEGMAEE